MHNRALNELEHRKVVSDYEDKVMAKGVETFFHDKVIAEESYRILIDAIDKLPPQMRKIILLALEGKNNPEIADELHVSGETVRSQKKAAYRKLRDFLKDYYYVVLIYL